jgi:hypothetical protein
MAFLSSSVGAQTSKGKGYLLTDGAKTTIIMRNVLSFDESMKLVKAGVHKSNPRLMEREITRNAACFVQNGTRVVVMDTSRTLSGYAVLEVMVIDGERSGCRGVVPSSTWSEGEPPAQIPPETKEEKS